MKYYMPTRIYCEDGCVKSHADELCALGKKALIVMGGSSAKKNGSLDDVIKALDSHGCSYELFEGVEENPSTDTVGRGADAAKSAKADFVIGIGGGSPLDAAKAIALMAANPEMTKDSLFQKLSLNAPLPVAAVPTTCGTGSEATGVSVLTRRDISTKGSIPYKIFPRLALCDGRYLSTAPKSLIANTAVDALAHLLESRLNSAADDLSIMTAEGGLKLWKSSLPVLLGEKTPDSSDFSRMMNASTAAGMAIAQTGTGIPHALSYALTCDGGIPHGVAVGYFLAPFVSLCDKNTAAETLALAGFSSADELDSFFRRVCGVTTPDPALIKKSAESVSNNPAKLATAPFAATPDDISAIVSKV